MFDEPSEFKKRMIEDVIGDYEKRMNCVGKHKEILAWFENKKKSSFEAELGMAREKVLKKEKKVEKV